MGKTWGECEKWGVRENVPDLELPIRMDGGHQRCYSAASVLAKQPRGALSGDLSASASATTELGNRPAARLIRRRTKRRVELLAAAPPRIPLFLIGRCDPRRRHHQPSLARRHCIDRRVAHRCDRCERGCVGAGGVGGRGVGGGGSWEGKGGGERPNDGRGGGGGGGGGGFARGGCSHLECSSCSRARGGVRICAGARARAARLWMTTPCSNWSRTTTPAHQSSCL